MASLHPGKPHLFSQVTGHCNRVPKESKDRKLIIGIETTEKTDATSTLQPSSTGFTACAYVQRRPPSRHSHGCIDHGRISLQPPLLQLGQHRGGQGPRKNLAFHGEVLAVQLVITLGVEVKVQVIKPVELFVGAKNVAVLKSFG